MQTLILEKESNLNIQFKARWARNLWHRFVGLLATPVLNQNEGLLLSPCSSVHTMWMRYSLDLIFMDKQGRVLKCVENVRPFRTASAKWAHYTLELPTGTIDSAGVVVGNRFTWSTN